MVNREGAEDKELPGNRFQITSSQALLPHQAYIILPLTALDLTWMKAFLTVMGGCKMRLYPTVVPAATSFTHQLSCSNRSLTAKGTKDGKSTAEEVAFIEF